MTKPVIRVAVAVLMLAACFAAAAAPRAVALAQVFPELADLPETGEVGIGIGWMGLSPLSPINASYILERHGEQFEGLGFFQFADQPAVKRAVTIPRDLVRALLTAANKVEVVESQSEVVEKGSEVVENGLLVVEKTFKVVENCPAVVGISPYSQCSQRRRSIMAITNFGNFGNDPGCSASVPEQKIATGTAQPEESEGLTSICSVFRFIFQF